MCTVHSARCTHQCYEKKHMPLSGSIKDFQSFLKVLKQHYIKICSRPCWPALYTTGQHFLLLASSSKLILAVLLALLVWRTHPPDRPKSFVKNDNIIFGASINDTGSQKTAPLPLKNCLHAFRKSSKLFVVVCSRHAKNPPDIIIINPLEKKQKTKNVTKINHCFPFFKFFFYGAILLDIQI